MLTAQRLRVVVAADGDQRRVEGPLLGVGVHRDVETHLVGQHPAVAAAGLEVLEQAVDDGVVIGDQVIDVAGQGLVRQRHGIGVSDGRLPRRHAPRVECY